MSREIHTDTAAALLEGRLYAIGLAKLEFESGTVRVWTGIGSLVTPDGETYTGIGILGRVGRVEESIDLRAVSVELELSGVHTDGVDVDLPTEVLDIARLESWQGRDAALYYGVLQETASGRVWVGEPFQIFGGEMDQMKLREGLEAAIALSLESDAIDLERAKTRRYTPEDQTAVYAGDKFFDAVASVQQIDFMWGRANDA